MILHVSKAGDMQLARAKRQQRVNNAALTSTKECRERRYAGYLSVVCGRARSILRSRSECSGGEFGDAVSGASAQWLFCLGC